MKNLTRMVMGRDRTALNPRHRATHTYVIGQSGTGKSRALESWVMQDVLAGRGVGVIDPHGDLFHNLLRRLADRPEVWNRVVVIDPLDKNWTVGFNPLEPIPGISQERLALYLTDVSIKVWKLSPSSAPRLVWLLTNSFLALGGLGLTLLDLPRFLVDRDYRERLLPKLSNEAARAYFQYEFPRSEGAVHQWVTPLMNKLGGLIFDPDVRLMFAGNTTINFREIMDRQMILLVNLPKGILGEGSSALLAAFIVAHLQKAALSRADTQKRTPFYLYLDEFQNYTTDNIQDILSESRKYALSLTLAHQYLDQLPNNLQSAVLNNTGTLISFRIGHRDATRLAKEVFPAPDFISKVETDFRLSRSSLLPLPIIRNKFDPLGWDGLALELAGLRHRQFWMRKRGPSEPIKQRSFFMPDLRMTRERRSNLKAMLDTSGQHFGQPKSVVKQDIENRRSRFDLSSQNGFPSKEDIPDWTA